MKIHFASCALVWLFCCSAQAAIINVPGDQPDIQTAINVAVNGDEIIVAQGEYFENINFNGKAITVRSTDPNDAFVVLNTIINGGGSGSVVTCSTSEGPGSVLSGFVITGGSGTVSGPITLGGGMYILNSSPTVKNCSFSGNFVGSFGGGGMYNENSSPTVTNCTFSGNSGNSGGGMLNNNSSPTMTNCLFSGNTARSGGGIFNTISSPTVVNCSFSGNSTSGSQSRGGGIYNEGNGNTTVTNGSVSGNPAISGGGISSTSIRLDVINCILWGDSSTEIIINLLASTVTYSNVQGGFPGLGNIDADPFFADPLGPDGTAGTDDDDLRLVAGSPCIDAANNGAVPVGVTTDLDGNPRFLDDPNTPDTGAGAAPLVDMGAYEFDPSCPADASGDGFVNVTDLLLLLGAWGSCPAPCPPDINNDGNVNVTDLLTLLAGWGACP